MRSEALPHERCNVRALGNGPFTGDLILVGGMFQIFDKLHLVEETCGVLRAAPVDFSLKLGDLEVLARDDRGGVGPRWFTIHQQSLTHSAYGCF